MTPKTERLTVDTVWRRRIRAASRVDAGEQLDLDRSFKFS